MSQAISPAASQSCTSAGTRVRRAWLLALFMAAALLFPERF